MRKYYSDLIDYLGDALNNYLEEAPELYFDTNVYLDIIDRRDKDSISLYEFALRNNWACITSIFAKVETLEVKQIHKFKELKRNINWSSSKIKNNLHKRDLSSSTLSSISKSVNSRIRYRANGFRQYSCLVENGWILAEDIKRKTNLTDKDSIHLAEARAIACDIMISKDKQLLDIAKNYIWAEAPNDLLKMIRRLNGEIQ